MVYLMWNSNRYYHILLISYLDIAYNNMGVCITGRHPANKASPATSVFLRGTAASTRGRTICHGLGCRGYYGITAVAKCLALVRAEVAAVYLAPPLLTSPVSTLRYHNMSFWKPCNARSDLYNTSALLYELHEKSPSSQLPGAHLIRMSAIRECCNPSYQAIIATGLFCTKILFGVVILALKMIVPSAARFFTLLLLLLLMMIVVSALHRSFYPQIRYPAFPNSVVAIVPVGPYL